jgi:NAD(P)-dependent dehydrogenase (short-subunit alcohol dehydrogenase family)
MSLLSLFSRTGATGFGGASTAEQVLAGRDLAGRTVVITGCNSGIGHETARVAAAAGARVIGTARTEAKAAEALAAMPGAVPVACELSEPSSVRAAADRIAAEGPVHAILANAGIMALPRPEAKYGLDLQFLTNHLGHFILITGLLDRLSDDGRVVLVSSTAHGMAPAEGVDFDDLDGSRRYRPWRNYGQSKLANLLMARELGRRFEGSGRTANAVHPGVINTNLGRHSSLTSMGFAIASPLFLKSIPQGAATQTYVALHPDCRVNGEYWVDCNVARSSERGRDAELARRLWAESERLATTIG